MENETTQESVLAQQDAAPPICVPTDKHTAPPASTIPIKHNLCVSVCVFASAGIIACVGTVFLVASVHQSQIIQSNTTSTTNNSIPPTVSSIATIPNALLNVTLYSDENYRGRSVNFSVSAGNCNTVPSTMNNASLSATWFVSSRDALVYQSWSVCFFDNGDCTGNFKCRPISAGKQSSFKAATFGTTLTTTTSSISFQKTCNGSPDACHLAWFNVAWPGSHNSDTSQFYNYNSMGYVAAECWYRNQDWSLVEQLEMGVRWLDLAFCEFEGEFRACHQGYSVAGEKSDALYNHLVDEIAQQVATFLDKNPNEVILIWLKNEGNPTETDRKNIWNRFNNPINGLSKYTFSATCKVGDCYTDTLQTMIDTNKRVIFTGWASPDIITGYPSNDWVFDTYNSNGQEWTATRDHYGTTWDLNYQISQAFSQPGPVQPVKFQALFGRPTLCWRDLSNHAYEISSSLFANHQTNAAIPFVTYLVDYVSPGHTVFSQTRSADAFRKNVAGTWIQSCKDASYTAGILNATCAHDDDDKEFESSLKSILCVPNSITNSNGHLSCTCLIGGSSNQTGGCGLRGSWTESCTGVSLYAGDVLTAVCKQSDGVGVTSSSVDTRKCIQEIQNNNGMLDC